DHMAAGIARGPGMLRDAQNLIRCRARALREDKEGLVPGAPRDGENRQQPGAAVEEEDERDGRGRHVRSAGPAGPPEEGEWGCDTWDDDEVWCGVSMQARGVRPHWRTDLKESVSQTSRGEGVM